MNNNVLEYMAAYFNMQEPQRLGTATKPLSCYILNHNREFTKEFMKERGYVLYHEDKYWMRFKGCYEYWLWGEERHWEGKTRGKRFDKVIIDRNIPKEEFCNLIIDDSLRRCFSMELI